MYKIRIHGRGGQGGRLAAKIIGFAAFLEGKNSQAFALYQAERRGAPVASFCRIDDKEILERGYIHDPDCLIILDDSLVDLKELKIFEGLKKNGLVLINTKKEKIKTPGKTVLIDAASIALEVLGKPIFNTAMLGVFLKKTKLLKLESVKKAVEHEIGKRRKYLVEKNIELVEKCYEAVK